MIRSPLSPTTLSIHWYGTDWCTIIAENITSFSIKLSARDFIAMSSEFTFGWQFWRVYHFLIFSWIWLTATSQSIRSLGHWRCLDKRAHLERTRWIRLFTHTTRWPVRQSESDCLITFWSKQENPSFNEVRFRGVIPVSESMAGTAWLRSTHRRCFSCWIWYAWNKRHSLNVAVAAAALFAAAANATCFWVLLLVQALVSESFGTRFDLRYRWQLSRCRDLTLIDAR